MSTLSYGIITFNSTQNIIDAIWTPWYQGYYLNYPKKRNHIFDDIEF